MENLANAVVDIFKERGVNPKPFKLFDGTQLIPEKHEPYTGFYTFIETVKAAAGRENVEVKMHSDHKEEFFIIIEIKPNHKIAWNAERESPHSTYAVIVAAPWFDPVRCRFIHPRVLYVDESTTLNFEDFDRDVKATSIAFSVNYFPDYDPSNWSEHLMAEPTKLAFGPCKFIISISKCWGGFGETRRRRKNARSHRYVPFFNPFSLMQDPYQLITC